MVSEADTPLVKLPVRLADAIDKGVRAFVRANTGLKPHYRWHDANLWMVYQEEAAAVNDNPVILQKRVTVAAFAGEAGFEPDIVFTPDILLIAPEGRYVLPAQKRVEVQSVLDQGWSNWTPDSLKSSIHRNLEKTWRKVLDLAKEPGAANVFLHSSGYREPPKEDQGR